MGQFSAVWDHKAAIEMTKDWNGNDQVLLRNLHGASVLVHTLYGLFLSLN